jgi:4'-phosphopantetheinyl transferase EntD
MEFTFGFGSTLIAQSFTSTYLGPEWLFPDERKLIRSFNKKRIHEFSTGRHCAHTAMSELGEQQGSVLIGKNNEPIWPKGLVGSISHAENLVGSVVSRDRGQFSIGMDIELKGRIKREIWPELFTQVEQNFLQALSPNECDFYSTSLFSLKESFYKYQFPKTGKYLDYLEVEIYLVKDNYTLRILTDNLENRKLVLEVKIEVFRLNNHVITLCYG